jgi:hypothetical protein
MLTIEDYLAEKMMAGQRGLDYELKIYNAIKQSSVKYFTPGDKPAAGFSNQGAGDIEGKLHGKPFNIEVKLSADDQMGGTSFRYDYKTKKFSAVNTIDPDTEQLLMDAAQQKSRALDAYIDAARKLEPVQYHKDISGVPIKVSKAGRDELKTKGLLKAINTKIITDASYIGKHYNKKGVYYIQIGGAGLFYMGRNIFDLPVPKLSGEIQIEVRLGFSGSKTKLPDGTEARSAGLRLIGRLKTKGKSPHTIDTIEGIEKLFTK